MQGNERKMSLVRASLTPGLGQRGMVRLGDDITIMSALILFTIGLTSEMV